MDVLSEILISAILSNKAPGSSATVEPRTAANYIEEVQATMRQQSSLRLRVQALALSAAVAECASVISPVSSTEVSSEGG
jgi:hypothetical protein